VLGGVIHTQTVSQSCIARNEWVCWDYVVSRQSDLTEAFWEHLTITVVAVALGVAVALPLAVLARRSRLFSGSVASTATLIYTIPSVALFSLLFPIAKLSATTVIIGLALYSLAILLRNTLDGLASVAPDAVDAGRGMGYSNWRLLLAVELPLALPAILAGVRIATVSTVALVTVGTLVGFGGFGDIIKRGFSGNFRPEVLTATVATVILALILDALLLALQRATTPWLRERSS